ncbi:MAG: hemolysin family protein [Myxococcota bacterium]|nr:hemolysin family protein [Myxococcota bacterium]
MIDYVVFGVLLFVSGFFSGSETALFSIGKVAHARLTQSSSAVEKLIARLVAQPRELLIGVLLGNELTNVALSVVSASITSRYLVDHSLLQQAFLSAALVVPLLLVFGEITPKTLASKRPEILARIVARPIAFFMTVNRPIIAALRGLTERFIAYLGAPEHGRDDPAGSIDESEFRTLIDVGAQEGVLEAQERTLIHNVLDFGDQLVADVMQPWDRVFSVSETIEPREAIELISGQPHSRIPVWRRDPQRVTGILLAKDLLPIRWGARGARSIRQLRRAPLFTLPERSVSALLEEFRRRRTHMAIVVDDYGDAIGFCTMEDLLEELFGPITDAHPGIEDPDERSMS